MNPVFNKNILTLVTGNAIAMVIPIALYPVLSRIFVPEDYAVFGLYVGIFSVLEIASAGRYDFAVVLARRDDEAINVVGSGLWFSVVYAGLILAIVSLTNEWIAGLLNNPLLARWLFLLPFALVLNAVSKLATNWLIRQKRFKAASFNKASQKVGEISTQMLFGALRLGNGLIIGDVIGRFFNAVVSFYQCVNAGFHVSQFTRVGTKDSMRQYVEFPKYNILPSMLNSLAGMIPMFIISSHFSKQVSGSFNFTRILLSIPFALIASSISQVLMQQIAEKKHEGRSIIHELNALAKRLIGLSIVGVLILAVWGPEIFAFVFGDKWRQAGDFTRILIFSTIISFVVSPYSILLITLGKVKYSAVWQVFYFVASACLWLLNGLAIHQFLIALVILDIVCYSLYGALIYSAVVQYERTITET